MNRAAGVWYSLALWALFVTEGGLAAGVQDGAVAMLEAEMGEMLEVEPAKQGTVLNDALVLNANKVLDDTKSLEPAAAANLAAALAKDEQPLFPAGSKEAAMDKLQKRVIGDQADAAKKAKATQKQPKVAPVKLDKHGKVIGAPAPAEAQASYDSRKAGAAKAGQKNKAKEPQGKKAASQTAKQLANAQAQKKLAQEKKSITDSRSPNCKTCHSKCKTETCRSWCEQKWCANEQKFDKAVEAAKKRKQKQNGQNANKGGQGGPPTQVVNNIIKVYSHKTFYQQKDPAVAAQATAKSAADKAADRQLEKPDKEPLSELDRQEPSDKTVARIHRSDEQRANQLINDAETSANVNDVKRAESAVVDVEKNRATDLEHFHSKLKKKGATKAMREYWNQKAMPAKPNATVPASVLQFEKKEAAGMAALTKRITALETAQANTAMQQQANANPENAMKNAEAAQQKKDDRLQDTVNDLYASITNQTKVNGTWNQSSANLTYRTADAEIAKSKSKEKRYKREMKSKEVMGHIKTKSFSIQKGMNAIDEMWSDFQGKKSKKAVKTKTTTDASSQTAIETSMAQRALKELRAAADQISKHAKLAHRHAVRAKRAASDTYAILGRPALYGNVSKSAYDATDGQTANNGTDAPLTEDQRVTKAKAEAEASVQDFKVKKKAHKIIMKHEIKIKENGAKKDQKLKAALKKAAVKKSAAKAKGKKATKKANKEAKKILKKAEAKVAGKKASAKKKAEGKGKGEAKKQKKKAGGKAKAIKKEAKKKIKKMEAKAANKGKASAKKAEKKADKAEQAAKDAAAEKDKSGNMAKESANEVSKASTQKKSAVKKLHQIEQKAGTRDDPKHIVNAVDGDTVKTAAKKDAKKAEAKAAVKAPGAATAVAKVKAAAKQAKKAKAPPKVVAVAPKGVGKGAKAPAKKPKPAAL